MNRTCIIQTIFTFIANQKWKYRPQSRTILKNRTNFTTCPVFPKWIRFEKTQQIAAPKYGLNPRAEPYPFLLREVSILLFAEKIYILHLNREDFSLWRRQFPSAPESPPRQGRSPHTDAFVWIHLNMYNVNRSFWKFRAKEKLWNNHFFEWNTLGMSYVCKCELALWNTSANLLLHLGRMDYKSINV